VRYGIQGNPRHDNESSKLIAMTIQSQVACPLCGTASPTNIQPFDNNFNGSYRSELIVVCGDMDAFRGHYSPRKEFYVFGVFVCCRPPSSLTFSICLAPASTTLLLAFFILSRKLMVIDVVGTVEEICF
jgi:hypothetical protein